MNEFKLFIAGETAGTRKISGDLESFLTAAFGSQYTLRVIDVIKNPQSAQENGILATPTLVTVTPSIKRVFGDFSDMGTVFKRLDVHLPSGTSDLANQ